MPAVPVPTAYAPPVPRRAGRPLSARTAQARRRLALLWRVVDAALDQPGPSSELRQACRALIDDYGDRAFSGSRGSPPSLV